MNQEEHTMMINKSHLKQQCQNLAYVIIVMHISFLREIAIMGAGADAQLDQQMKEIKV